MLPTIDAGVRSEVLLDYSCSSAPDHGNMIAFRMPDEVAEDFRGLSGKRLLGLLADRIALLDDQDAINECILDEQYVSIPKLVIRPNSSAAP